MYKALSWLKTGKVPKSVVTPTTIVTKANADTFAKGEIPPKK